MVKFTRSKTPSVEDTDGAAAAPLSQNGVPTAAAVGGKGAQGSPLGKIRKRLSLGSSKNKTAAADAKQSKETSNGITAQPKQSNHVTAGPGMHNDELSTVTEVTEPATVNGSMQPSNLSPLSTTGTNGDDTPKGARTPAAADESTTGRGGDPVVHSSKESAPKGTKPSALARLKKRTSFSKATSTETAPAVLQEESNDKATEAPADDLAVVPEARASRIVDPAAAETVDRRVDTGAGAAPKDKDDATSEPEVDSPTMPAQESKPGALAKLKHKLSFTKSSPAKEKEDNVGPENTTKTDNKVVETDLPPVTESGKSHILSAAAVQQTETELAVGNAAPVDTSVHAIPVTVYEQEVAVMPSASIPAEDKDSALEKLRKKISFSKAKSEKVEEDTVAENQDYDHSYPLAAAGESNSVPSDFTDTRDDVSRQPSEDAAEPALTSSPVAVEEDRTVSAKDKESAVQELRKKLSFATATSPAGGTTGDEDPVGDVHPTGGIAVTIPPPLPDSELKTIGTADEIANQIKSAINAAPNMPGDGWDEDQTDPKPQDPTNVPHPHWKTNPQTGRPIPPDGSAPPNVSQELLAILQNEKMMRENGVFDVLHKMGRLKFLRTAQGIGDGDGQDGQGDGGEDSGNEDDGDVYQRVDGLMLYAPLVPAEGDKVELADVLIVDPSAKKEKVRTIRAQDVKKKKGLAGLMSLWGLGWAVGSGAGKATTTQKEDVSVAGSPGAPAASAPAKDGSIDVPALAKKASLSKKVNTLSADATTTWVPSTTKISFQAMWWGFKLYLPPPVMDILSDDTVEAVKRAAMITSALTWFFTNIPVDMIPLPLQPAFVILQEVIPYISYIGTFITWSWSELKSFDEGYGVILTATWLLPVALIPGTWKQEDFPTDPAPPSGTTPGDGTTPPTTTPPTGTSPPSGTTPPAGTTPPTETAPPTTTPPASGDPSNEPSTTPAPSSDRSKTPTATDPSAPPSTKPSQPTAPTPGGSATPAPAPADPSSLTPTTSPINKNIDGEGIATEAKDNAPKDGKKRSSWKLW